jgi:hypothetical protein
MDSTRFRQQRCCDGDAKIFEERAHRKASVPKFGRGFGLIGAGSMTRCALETRESRGWCTTRSEELDSNSSSNSNSNSNSKIPVHVHCHCVYIQSRVLIFSVNVNKQTKLWKWPLFGRRALLLQFSLLLMPNLKVPGVLSFNRASKHTHWLPLQILSERKSLAHQEKLKLLHVHLVSVKVKRKVVFCVE